VPAGAVGADEWSWIQSQRRDGGLSGDERAALEFIAALVNHRRRFDIDLDEPAPEPRDATDIEIEG
jgi:hypothetical protein